MRKILLFISITSLFLAGCSGQPASTEITEKNSPKPIFENADRMYGPSMEPTIHEQEFMVVDPNAELKRGDIVVFSSPIEENQLLVKRIIGLPNETIEFENGKLKLTNDQNPNGVILDEPYIPAKIPGSNFENTTYPYSNLNSFKIPQNGYFVLGDNRIHSSDSRSCFITLNAQDRDNCIKGKIPFYITKGNIKGVVIRHAQDIPKQN